jgi:hypothetical protein
MTYTININGHDDLSGDEKEEFEKGVVEKARALVRDLRSASNVSSATATTNTTGSQNLLDES